MGARIIIAGPASRNIPTKNRSRLIKNSKAKLLGFASLIDRSSKQTLKIKKRILSQLKISVPTYKKKKLPKNLISIPVTKPGSRFIK